MIKHRIFVGFLTFLIIILIILTLRISPDNKSYCNANSDCFNNQKCINHTCQTLLGFTCIDTDQINFYTKGKINQIFHYSFTNITKSYEDYCINNSFLVEWYCYNGTPMKKTICCSSGCIKGHCELLSKVKDLTPLSLNNRIFLDKYGLDNFYFEIINVIHNNTDGYSYVDISLNKIRTVNNQTSLFLGERSIRIGSSETFNISSLNKTIKVFVASIYASAKDYLSAVQLKINVYNSSLISD